MANFKKYIIFFLRFFIKAIIIIIIRIFIISGTLNLDPIKIKNYYKFMQQNLMHFFNLIIFIKEALLLNFMIFLIIKIKVIIILLFIIFLQY